MKSHYIELDHPTRLLVVTEPDEAGYWHFAINDGVHNSKPYVYTRFANELYFAPSDERFKGWEDDLSDQLRSPLYHSVSSNFLDTEWVRMIFPQVVKIVQDYNSSPVDAE